MKKQRTAREKRDLLQNITIVLLALSAAFLMIQSQFYNTGLSRLFHFSDPVPVVTNESAVRQPVLAAPVRVAVSGTYGRFGDLCATTDSSAFEPLGTLLREVLGSAGNPVTCSELDFLSALSEGISIYYDFGTPLPLSVLAGLVGADMPREPLFARRLVVSNQGSSRVSLFLWDNDYTCLRCTTALTRSSLLDIIRKFEPGSATFAMDGTGNEYAAVSPLSLFPSEEAMPQPPRLFMMAGLPNLNQVLTTLNFNPHTNLRYMEANGTEVIVEGERTLRIRSDGTITYQSGGKPVLSINNFSGNSPSPWEAAVGGSGLLHDILGDSTGDAKFCLHSIQQDGPKTVLQFDYQVAGLPVHLSNNAPAAEITLSHDIITALTLRFRQYTDSGQPSLLLPLQQALAVAADSPGKELILGYVDAGEDVLEAQWLSE